jgi:hypothetical protein
VNPESILILVLLLGALWVVTANDRRLKRRAEAAKGPGRTVRKDTTEKKSQRPVIIAIAVGAVIYAILLNNPGEWMNRDFGPLTPLVRLFFEPFRK